MIIDIFQANSLLSLRLKSRVCGWLLVLYYVNKVILVNFMNVNSHDENPFSITMWLSKFDLHV